MKWSTDKLREAYLNYFEERGHEIKEGSGLIPDDPSMLFTSAGMVQFKDIFWGRRQPDVGRAATCQKCFRAKDIEEVGNTWYHHTFFEMLGNFSFGDYFKRGAIELAWEFVTEVLRMEEERLWISVHETDQEAYDIWKDEIGVPERKIVRLGDSENWWGPVGDSGPCGPDSEIFYDAGEEYKCGPDCEGLACDCNRFNELWNLVFTGYEMDREGNVTELASQNIDTGMGLERVSAVLQGVDSDYEIDIFRPLISELKERIGLNTYNDDQVGLVRRIGDHIRGAAFLISEGVIPSNEGQGYVLRRLIRRAVQAGDRLGMKETFLTENLEPVYDTMGETYPELLERSDLISNVIQNEEESYRETLTEGEELFYRLASDLSEESPGAISGADAFRLYDTHGLPLSFLKKLAHREGLEVDEVGFKKEMKKQRSRSRAGQEEGDALHTFVDAGETEFVGYEVDEVEAEVLALIVDDETVEEMTAGDEGFVVLDCTPFYAEAGGQVSDVGTLSADSLEASAGDVTERKGVYYHGLEVEGGEISVGDKVVARVDSARRRDTERNHTATHLLHKALIKTLGPHVVQSGSKVSPEELRFDFNHFEIPGDEQIAEIEDIVNSVVLDNLPVTVDWVGSVEEARSIGAAAHFDEEYRGKEKLRIISVGDFSKELCGGTHVDRSGDVGGFAIKSIETISSGIRRVRAVTGTGFLSDYREKRDREEELAGLVRTGPRDLVERVESILERQEELREELERKNQRLLMTVKGRLMEDVRTEDGVDVLSARPNVDSEDLQKLADMIEAELTGVIVLGTSDEDSASV
ncbi:MAG: alanine--tRNA ligase, partial [Candidatus Bipolaricaulota bacterium]